MERSLRAELIQIEIQTLCPSTLMMRLLSEPEVKTKTLKTLTRTLSLKKTIWIQAVKIRKKTELA